MKTAAIVNACLDTGNESAWLSFIARFQPLIAAAILRVCRRYCQLDPALVDDLVQETYLRLCRENYKALRSFRERHEDAILAYLKVIATTVALDHFRARMRQKRRVEVFESADVLPEIAILPVGIEQIAQIAELDRSLAASESERDRSIFWLYYRQGYTAKDIAGIPGIGLTQKGIESCIYRITQSIRARSKSRERQRPKGETSEGALGVVK